MVNKNLLRMNKKNVILLPCRCCSHRAETNSAAAQHQHRHLLSPRWTFQAGRRGVAAHHTSKTRK